MNEWPNRDGHIDLVTIVRHGTSHLMEKKRGDRGVQRGWSLPRLLEEDGMRNNARERKICGCEHREMKRRMKTGPKQAAQSISFDADVAKANETARTEIRVSEDVSAAHNGTSSSKEDLDKLSLLTVPIHPRERRLFDWYLERKHGEEAQKVWECVRPPQRIVFVHPHTAVHGRGRWARKTQCPEQRRSMRQAPGRGRGRMMTAPRGMDDGPLERSVKKSDPPEFAQTQPNRVQTWPRKAYPRRQSNAVHQADGQRTRHVKQTTTEMRRDWSQLPRNFLISVVERIHRSNVTLLLEMDMV